jgi:hypothetical protein
MQPEFCKITWFLCFKKTWYKARDWCDERGMQLASLKNVTLTEAVTQELKSRGCKKIKNIKLSWDWNFPPFGFVAVSSGVWTSASDIGRTAGQYHWMDGTPLDKSVWHRGDPDTFSAGNVTCAFLATYFNPALLVDYTCLQVWDTLCEFPTELLFCVQ